MLNKRKSLLLALMLGIALLAGACAPAPQDASKARSRALINRGVIVPAEEVRVAEYLNYYEQHFPAPTETALGLDLRLGNEQIPSAGGEVWLQIGVQAREAEGEQVTPMNLALVIDRSGSMNAPDKWPYLRQSLRVFFRSLDPDDIVAVIGYDDQAEAVLPAQRVGNRRWVERTIERLYPRGCTNLHAGLMLGFREVDKNFDIRRNNRVILLTDGIANRGVTDPDQIAREALAYNERGIYLSTIGLGLDFNDQLLSQLARQGKGAYHFIDSAEEMDKVFRREVAGLVEKVARDVAVTVYPGQGVEMVALTGYDGRPPAGPVQITMQELGTGDGEVLLAQLQVSPGRGRERLVATVTLDYFDIFAQRPEQVTQEVKACTGAGADYDPLWDLEILRNATIQRTAEGLKEIDRLYQARRYEDAWKLAYDLEQMLREVARLTDDEAMVKDAELMQRYQSVLAEQIRYEGGRVPQPASEGKLRPYRGRTAQPTPSVPVLEVH
jgi:Ca-activated chloride channel family protein